MVVYSIKKIIFCPRLSEYRSQVQGTPIRDPSLVGL